MKCVGLPSELPSALLAFTDFRTGLPEEEFYDMPRFFLSIIICVIYTDASKKPFKGTENERENTSSP